MLNSTQLYSQLMQDHQHQLVNSLIISERQARQFSKECREFYQHCNNLIQILSDWRSKNYNKPAMKWKKFGELCQVKVPSLRIRSRNDNKERVEMKRRAIATCLHHIGEVVYFDELGFLILDCEWFCGEALGQLIKLNVRKRHLLRLWQVYQIALSSKPRKSEYRFHRDFIALYRILFNL